MLCKSGYDCRSEMFNVYAVVELTHNNKSNPDSLESCTQQLRYVVWFYDLLHILLRPSYPCLSVCYNSNSFLLSLSLIHTHTHNTHTSTSTTSTTTATTRCGKLGSRSRAPPSIRQDSIPPLRSLSLFSCTQFNTSWFDLISHIYPLR